MPHQYLDLRTIPPEQRTAVVAAFDKGNTRRLVSLLADTAGVGFVDAELRPEHRSYIAMVRQIPGLE